MRYRNARRLFPTPLLIAMQDYVDGEYVYIPRKEENRREWGAGSGSKRETLERNGEIFRKRLEGCSVEALAKDYFLSAKTIYGILKKAEG